jgi:hypothetical protein
MINFQEFWEDTVPNDEDHGYGNEPEPPRPGVTGQDIIAWEEQHGVALPSSLRQAFAVRNGGVVRYSSVRIEPLERIKPADDDFWEYANHDAEAMPDRRLVFTFADDEDSGGQYLLNFNALGPRGEPSVCIYHSDPGDVDEASASLAEFLARLLAVSSGPAVNWAEIDSPGLTILARETIDVSPVFGRGAEYEGVLAHGADALVLFTHLRSKQQETIIKLTLPLPLDPNSALLRPLRPGPISTHCLHLQPTRTDNILHVQSTRASDGKWKTTNMRGAPIYGYFESKDRDVLTSLRARLLGEQAANAMSERERSEAQFEQELNSLSPDARRAAMIQAALKAKEEIDRTFTEQFGTLEPPRGELANLAQLMQARMAEALARVQAGAANAPPDPKTQNIIGEMLTRILPWRKRAAED